MEKSGKHSEDDDDWEFIPQPSAPPYSDQLPSSHTKGIDWSLNSGGPSVPSYNDLASGSSSKGLAWSLNRPQTEHEPGNDPPSYHNKNSGTVQQWRSEFERHYPSARMSRDNPSIIKVEIPKNRAFPVIGHATCPDCYSTGPHHKTAIKKNAGVFSLKKTEKIPAQKCKGCQKLVYFIHGAAVVEHPTLSTGNRPPPYTNQPSRDLGDRETSRSVVGHGWSDGVTGHGWDPGQSQGHGWGHS